MQTLADSSDEDENLFNEDSDEDDPGFGDDRDEDEEKENNSYSSNALKKALVSLSPVVLVVW